jgi:O-phosphoseryl-tRNA(Cys) synthetase
VIYRYVSIATFSIAQKRGCGGLGVEKYSIQYSTMRKVITPIIITLNNLSTGSSINTTTSSIPPSEPGFYLMIRIVLSYCTATNDKSSRSNFFNNNIIHGSPITVPVLEPKQNADPLPGCCHF